MIIHICGPSGSGKSTLGNKIKTKYGSKIIVKDLDELFFEFIKEKEKENDSKSLVKEYQRYIFDYIKKREKKNIIFVGLNTGIGSFNFLGKSLNFGDVFFDLKADYKFYIDIPMDEVLKQKFYRQIGKLYKDKELLFERWLKNHELIQSKLNYSVNLKVWERETKWWNRLYKNKDYIFMSAKDILFSVSDILNNK